MRNEKLVVGENEVVNPDFYRALALGVSPEVWCDAQTVAPMLDDADLGRALQVLRDVGGLGYLLRQDTPGLKELGLTKAECVRFQSFPALANRVLCARSGMADPSTRRDVADEISFRGLQFDTATAGVIAWDAQSRRVADRIVAIGTTQGTSIDLRQALRIAICSGGVTMVLWVWQPVMRIQVSEQERDCADELRVMATALHLVVEDVLLVGMGDAVSLALLDGWRP